MTWLAENKNRDKITTIHFIIRKIAKTTNYDDEAEVIRNSKRVRNLFKTREKLYKDGNPLIWR